MRIAIRQGVDWGIAGLLLAAVAFGVPQSASAQFTHVGDVRIDGSLGIGFDMTSSYSFGFNTLVMRENNLRMFFEDTSTAASFPSNDWKLVANDSSNGGDNYFAIEDTTGGRQIFRVAAGAPSSSLWVDSAGDVGVGESNPVVELHIQDGDTPTVRLEQDGSSGFTPQTWDLAGNETNFFIRDVTNGSTLPFRIRPGAPTSAIDVSGDGDVGINNANPNTKLHVIDSSNQFTLEDSDDGQEWRFSANAGVMIFEDETAGTIPFRIAATAPTHSIRIIASGDVGIKTAAPTEALEVTGNILASGTITPGSSREYKKDISDLGTEEALAAFDALDTVKFVYKADPHNDQQLGFIAEDVPELVATHHRKGISTMDIAALLTKVVQEQRNTIEELSTVLEDQRQTIDQLSTRVKGLEQQAD